MDTNPAMNPDNDITVLGDMKNNVHVRHRKNNNVLYIPFIRQAIFNRPLDGYNLKLDITQPPEKPPKNKQTLKHQNTKTRKIPQQEKIARSSSTHRES